MLSPRGLYRPCHGSLIFIPHAVIDAVSGYQLAVCAFFGNLALCYHQYLVGILYASQMMGDHQHCLSFSQLVQGFLYQCSFSGSAKAVASSRTTIGASFKIVPRQCVAVPSRKECSIYSYLPCSIRWVAGR